MDNTINQELSSLLNSLDQHDWFCDAEFDAFGRFVIYVHDYPLVFASELPATVGGKQVLIHYASSQPSVIPAPIVVVSQPEVIKLEVKEPEVITSEDMQYLTSELDRLEKICGSNILADLFFESHDQKNAVTNLTSRFPEVRKCIDSLYEMYGFDIIYENLEM